MSENKTSISQAQSYQEIGQFWDTHDVTDYWDNKHVKAEGDKYMTIDVARKGKDNTVYRVWHGWKCIYRYAIDKSDLKVVVRKAEQLQIKYKIPLSNVIADEDGVGGGVVDSLKCKGFVNNSRPIKEKGKETNFANLKSQCYFRLAEYVNSSKIFVSCNEQTKQTLLEELEVIRRKDADKDGKVAVEGKDRVKELIGRSPDISDALMMRMYFEISKTTTRW